MTMLMREEKVIEWTDSGVARTQVTLHEPPFFYRGRTPLRYESGVQHLGSTRIVLWSQFPDFRIDYSLEHQAKVPGVGISIRGSAIAKDAAGKQLARAEVVELTKGSGFFVHEEHFDTSGNIVYSAKSFFGFDGQKTSEAEANGKKQRDYFFLWPTGH